MYITAKFVSFLLLLLNVLAYIDAKTNDKYEDKYDEYS
jgi:hypothetical protein